MDEKDDFVLKEAIIKYLPAMTAEEYLRWEDRQEQRHEFVDGEIIKIDAATISHSRILMTITGEIRSFLDRKKCEVFPNTLRVFAKSRKSYFYPDATIFCDEPESIEESQETYKNPSVIFEVLSPPTIDYDMGRKMFFYMQIESLKEYIVIHSKKMEVRTGRRLADNSWKFDFFTEPSDQLTIETIGFAIKLSEIYSGVNLK